MNSAELKEEFRRIVKKDTKLDAGEQVGLLNRYCNMYDAVAIGLAEDEVNYAKQKIAGTLEYLTEMGKIQDDEDLWMLINEIEKGA